MIPEQLQQEVAELIQAGHLIEMMEDAPCNRVYIVIKNYPLPSNAYNMQSTDLLIYTTLLYPSSGFDMFWVNENLLLANGNVPQSAGHMELACRELLGIAAGNYHAALGHIAFQLHRCAACYIDDFR